MGMGYNMSNVQRRSGEAVHEVKLRRFNRSARIRRAQTGLRRSVIWVAVTVIVPLLLIIVVAAGVSLASFRARNTHTMRCL